MKRLWPIALLLAGCSALGLSDGLEQAPCMRCEELDDIDTPPMCMSWQCTTPDDPANGVCELDFIDRDGDNFPDPMCAMDERPGDCDDADRDNRPMGTEMCDLQDNDCDGAIDENVLASATQSLIDGQTSNLSFARGEDELAVTYVSTTGSLTAARLPFDGAEPLAVAAFTGGAMPEETAVGSAGSSWAIAYAERSGCSRVVLGLWNGSGNTLEVSAGLETSGLPKVGGGDCGSGDTTEAGSPAVAANSGRQALVAYMRQRRRNDDCSDEPAEVVLVVATRNDEGTPTFTDYGEAVVAGTSTDSEAPSLVAISTSVGYLLAFADDSGIGVHRVAIEGARTPVVSELYRESCTNCGDASLTWVDGELALAYREGDCTSGTPTLRRLQLDTAAPSITALEGGLLTADPGNVVRRPVAARRTGPEEWGLIWTSAVAGGQELRLQRFSVEDGLAVGMPTTLLSTMQAFPEPIALLAGAGAGGYRGFAYDTESRQVRRVDLTCPPSE